MQLLQINPEDNVCVAMVTIKADQLMHMINCIKVVCARNEIPAGHKVANAKILNGKDVVKGGVVIGKAIQDINPGEHVHSHNLVSNYLNG